MSGFLNIMTVMTLMMVVSGPFLSAGAVLHSPSALSRGQGDTVHPKVVVTGNFGNRDNRTGSHQAEESVADYLLTATRKILEDHRAYKVTEVTEVIDNWLLGTSLP